MPGALGSTSVPVTSSSPSPTHTCLSDSPPVRTRADIARATGRKRAASTRGKETRREGGRGKQHT